ncbi:MAG: glycyl-tRNA synthetase beta chain [Fusobacteria bacterium]|nr:MAG: glycyl-tRNA synthetase beta chain [Fusobacteriota bacterium]KAF0229743.1 MAG: glycyl-tRNA synthetase beta [Fusobacteriota bacterium]
MADYLLEIGLEEVPAGKIDDVISQLSNKMVAILTQNRIAYESIKTFGTPRRIGMRIIGLALKGESITIEIKGPSVKAGYKDEQPTKALEGFCRGQGIDPTKLVVKKLNNDEYLYAIKETQGIDVKNEIASFVVTAISSINFSKPMYWGEGVIQFIRPIRTLISLWNDEILPLEYGGIKADRKSRGHRFLFDGEIEVAKAADYESTLESAFVIVDKEVRKKLVLEGIAKKEQELNCKVIVTDNLLQEVLYLVEYPTVFVGTFTKEYLKLPKEVITTTMVNNQKYFPVTNETGNVMPFFIGVRCGNDYSIDKVISGNEKVLKARLEDARFFFEEDKKVPLLELRTKLDKVIYQKQLGTIGDKIDRIVNISKYLGKILGYEGNDLLIAAKITKMDLASHMVYEFPELQGIMGYYYSLLEGYNENIAISIKEHYMPINAGDDVPRSKEGIIVGLADKIDSITSIFKAGLIPSGSQDPYALRRMALGIIRTIIENEISISIKDLLTYSQEQTNGLENLDLNVYLDFFKTRFKSYLEKEGYKFDVIDSIFALEFDDILDLFKKASALKKYSENENFNVVVGLLVRINNIVKNNLGEDYDKNLLQDDYEIKLANELGNIIVSFEENLKNGNYLDCYKQLEVLKVPLDQFFLNVMVMVEDEDIRNNRINLLISIKKLGDQLFSANKIVS